MHAYRWVWLVLCLLVAACARPAQMPAPARASAPADFPAAYYADAAARGEPAFRIDPQRSLATIRVHRGGPLARFGHDHVVVSRDIRGYVLLASASAAGRADFYAPLDLLSVDEPEMRAAAGLDASLSNADIAATRRNMLVKVLEAERFPWVQLSVGAGEPGPAFVQFSAAVVLHGETRRIPISAEVETTDAKVLRVRGRFSLNQTDFGIAPFTALSGALRVEDRLDVAFELYGVRISPTDTTR